MRIAYGSAFIMIGVMLLVSRRRGASMQTKAHQQLSRGLPWLYRVPFGRWFLSPDIANGMAIVAALIFVIGGILFLTGAVGSNS